MMRLKRFTAAAILGGLLAAPALVAAAPAQAAVATPTASAAPIRYCPQVITQADSGKTIPMALGSCAYLELDSGLIWSPPVVNGNSVVVVPICSGPMCPLAPTAAAATSTYEVNAVAPGVSTITSLGRPNCVAGQPCPQFVVLFQVTIDVFLPPSAA